MANPDLVKATKASLTRLQEFDAKALARTDQLGQELSFSPAVAPAEKLISFYRRIPESIVDDLSDDLCNNLKQQADADFNRFEQVLKFTSAQANAYDQRQSLVQQIATAYDATFRALWHFVAYGVARVTDTSILENQARATLQSIQDEAKALTDNLKGYEETADTILTEIKAVAAEQGVSQQAQYFKEQSDAHERQARFWQKRVYWAAGLVAAFAIFSIFLHKWDWLAPKTALESAQIISSKILIFAVLGYLLVLSVKNYLSHKHNEVVNRHRQTALQTYRALASAAHERAAEDIIVAHAAACIFSPQDTGYTKPGPESGAPSRSVLELFTRGSARTDVGS